MWSITGGHMLLVSTASSFISVLASVSSRWAARSASRSGARSASSVLPAAAWAASAAREAFSALPTPGRRVPHRSGRRGQIGSAGGGRRKARLDVGDFALDPGDALGLCLECDGELVAARGEIGQCPGQFGEGAFSSGDHLVRGGNT